MVLCIGVFAVSVFGITGTLVNARREKSTFDDLIEMAEEGNAEDSQDVSGDIAASGTEQQSDAGNGDTLGNSVQEEKPKRNYALLKEKNPDFAMLTRHIRAHPASS